MTQTLRTLTSVLLFLTFNFTTGVAMAIEEPAFSVESKTDVYEIRKYDPYLVAEVKVQGSFAEAGNKGFRPLADFIFGNNTSSAKIDMTSPVSQKPQSEKIEMTAPVNLTNEGGAFVVQFAMPKKYTLETLPKPNDPRVQIREIAAKRVAVLSYSGSWSEERYQKKLALLLSSLEKDGHKVIGDASFARYNPPWQLWFLRRNEIWVEVTP
jgi:effector-binding domain-containing protein